MSLPGEKKSSPGIPGVSLLSNFEFVNNVGKLINKKEVEDDLFSRFAPFNPQSCNWEMTGKDAKRF